MNSSSSGNIPVIYVTGFGPFGSHSENASQKVVEKLASLNNETEFGFKIHTEVLDVAYECVLDKVPSKWSSLEPKLVIHIGVSSLAKEITLEKRAFNCDYTQPDIRSCLPFNGECVIGFDHTIQTQLDLERAVREVEKESTSHLKFCVSFDPGRYLCGFVYFLSLSIDECRSLFIHVPSLHCVCLDPEIAVAKLAESVVALIKCLYRQVQELEEERNPKREDMIRLKGQPRPKKIGCTWGNI